MKEIDVINKNIETAKLEMEKLSKTLDEIKKYLEDLYKEILIDKIVS